MKIDDSWGHCNDAVNLKHKHYSYDLLIFLLHCASCDMDRRNVNSIWSHLTSAAIDLIDVLQAHIHTNKVKDGIHRFNGRKLNNKMCDALQLYGKHHDGDTILIVKLVMRSKSIHLSRRFWAFAWRAHIRMHQQLMFNFRNFATKIDIFYITIVSRDLSFASCTLHESSRTITTCKQFLYCILKLAQIVRFLFISISCFPEP